MSSTPVGALRHIVTSFFYSSAFWTFPSRRRRCLSVALVVIQLHAHTLPERFANHAPGLEKWWKAWVRTNGRVVEHISPYQQRIIMPLFEHPKQKALYYWDKFKYAVYASPILLTPFYLDWKYAQMQRAEWP